tara:strand:+ start:123 stop:236 length:114 start_codon:yes stop_codon:yes gene_type:complete
MAVTDIRVGGLVAPASFAIGVDAVSEIYLGNTLVYQP